MLLLGLALGSLPAAQSVKVQALHHPGHPPHHVTRLHRYDHSGMQSMIQAEAHWDKQAEELQQRRQLKEIRHIRGSSMLQVSALLEQDAVQESDSFVQLSDVQDRALREHHDSWNALLQTAMEQGHDKDEEANSGKAQAGNPKGALLQKYKAYMSAYRANHTKDSVVATGLSNLNSQYVGPIGVGTVVKPDGCVMKDLAGADLKLMEDSSKNSSLLGIMQGMITNVSSKFTGLASKAGSPESIQAHYNTNGLGAVTQACTLEDQSKIWVVFDTGSTNIWISSDLCSTGACKLPGRHKFNHTASATFNYPSSMLNLTVQFGTGKITGPQAVDDFHIGPFTVASQTFAMIQTEAGSVFHDVPFEGIVGMAFDKMSANGVQPFFDSVIKQKALKNNEFAFYFSKDNPSANAIFWGGVDKSFYDGELQYFPVVDPYYWSLKLLNFKIGNDVLLGPSDTYKSNSLLETSNPSRKWNGPVAIVDTGTTFFTAEADKFSSVMEKIPPAMCNVVTDTSHPPITVTLENVLGKAADFVMTNKQYMTQYGTGDKAHCSPAFMQIDLPQAHGPGMVLGEVFLRHFFGVFDRASGDNSEAKIAFGQSSSKDAAVSRLHELTADQPKFGSSGVAKAAAEPDEEQDTM